VVRRHPREDRRRVLGGNHRRSVAFVDPGSGVVLRGLGAVGVRWRVLLRSIGGRRAVLRVRVLARVRGIGLAAAPYVQSFRLSSGGIERRIVSVYAVQNHPEAALDRRLWVIFELEGSADGPVLALRDVASDRSVPTGLELYAVVDLHNDGGLALLYTSDEGRSWR
jgi:hypothetical protein